MSISVVCLSFGSINGNCTQCYLAAGARLLINIKLTLSVLLSRWQSRQFIDENTAFSRGVCARFSPQFLTGIINMKKLFKCALLKISKRRNHEVAELYFFTWPKVGSSKSEWNIWRQKSFIRYILLEYRGRNLRNLRIFQEQTPAWDVGKEILSRSVKRFVSLLYLDDRSSIISSRLNA